MTRLEMAATLAAVAVGAAACVPPGELSRSDLAGTIWHEVCPDTSIVTATVELRLDGLMGWSYAPPETLARDGFRLDSVHTWAVADGALEVRWNLGSARSRYHRTTAGDTLRGDASTFCLPGPTLVRYRPSALTSRSPRTVTEGTQIQGESVRTGDGL